MSDRYRRLLESYRNRVTPLPGKVPTRELPPQQAEILLRMVDQMNEDAKSAPQALLERRAAVRRPFPHMALVTPCVALHLPRLESSVAVIARDLSSRGFSFVQTGVFPEPYFLVTFQVRGLAPVCLYGKVLRQMLVRLGIHLVAGEFLERVSLGDNHGPHGQSGEELAKE